MLDKNYQYRNTYLALKLKLDGESGVTTGEEQWMVGQMTGGLNDT